MRENPLVTVYIPTFNRLELLKRAVNSVICQDYENIEVIIVDDGSNDGTVEYIKEEFKNNRRIVFFSNAVNSGACASRNKAIMAANGDFITGLDDDDYFLENHISSLVNKWLSLKEDVSALYVNTIREIKPNKFKKAYPKMEECHAKDMVCANWPGNQVFTKTEFLRSIGGFDEKFAAWQDYDCWYRLLNAIDKKAECTGLYTYVLDISHGYGRISESEKDKIIKSFDRFVEKNNIAKSEIELVKLLLANYGIRSITFKGLIKKIRYSKSPYNIRHAFILLYFYIVRLL